ncbi:VIT protein, partial [Polypterus senegalus]
MSFMFKISIFFGTAEPNFSSSKTYEYTYEGLVLTGLPEKGLARAGLKINSKVQISEVAQRTFMLRIINPEIQEYNGVWPKATFYPATKLTQALARQLTEPIKFEYSNGRVGNIYAPADVSDTVVNIQRGILNMLQVTIRSTQNVYELQEDGIAGTCHSSYVVQDVKRSNKIVVTKSKDLNNCDEKVIKNIGTRFMQHCRICDQIGRNAKATAAYTYILKPTEFGALITEATSQEVHQFSPFNAMNGAALTEARQKLILVDVKAIRNNVPEQQFQNRGSIKYEFATEILQTPIQLLKTKSPESKIKEILQHLVQNNHQEVHRDAPAKFLELTQLFRASTYENIEGIWKQYENTPQYRRWILDTLPATATPNAFRFIIQRVMKKDLTIAEAAQTLVTAMLAVKVDHQTMQLAADLIEDNSAIRAPALYKHAVLAYGSMVFKYCAESSSCSESALKVCMAWNKTLLVADVHKTMDATARAHEEEIVLALKAIGNAGQPASLKRIQKFLPGIASGASQYPVKIQADAVMALRNIAKKEPRKVQEIVLQLFMDHKNHPEVRMVASVVLFESEPPVALVTAVAEALLKESSLQVASFAYSQMKALSRSISAVSYKVSSACTIALKMLSPRLDRLSYRYSKALYTDTYQYSLMAGLAAKLYIMNNAANIIPTAVMAKFKIHLLGATATPLEVGLRAEGLQEALTRNHEDINNFPSPRKIEQIVKKLSGWKSIPSEKTLASAYIKLFGQEVSFAHLDKKYIQEALQAVREPVAKQSFMWAMIQQIQRGISTEWSKPMLAAEMRRIVPTCVGFPMETSLYSASVATIAVNAQAQITPTPSSDFHVAQLMNSNILLRSDISPSVGVHTVAMMGINTHAVQSGVELYTKAHTIVPMKFTAKIDMKENNFKISSEPCQQETELISVRSQAYAVSRNIEDLDAAKETPVLPDDAEADILKEKFNAEVVASTERERAGRIARLSAEMMSQDLPNTGEHQSRRFSKSSVSFCSKAKNYGFQVCMESKSENAAYLRRSPLYQLAGHHVCKILLKPAHTSDSTVEKIEFELQTGPKAASKMIKTLSMVELPEAAEAGDKILSKLKTILTADDRAENNRNPEIYDYKFRAHDYMFKYMGDSSSPVFVIVARAIKSDGKQQGYQVAGYADLTAPKPRIQVLAADITERSKWQVCADALMANDYKGMAIVRWGQECQDYRMAMQLESGRLANHPSVKLTTKWWRIPSSARKAYKKFGEYVKGMALFMGFAQKEQKNPSSQCSIIFALTSPRTIDTIIKTPKLTLFKRAVQIPFAVPQPALSAEQKPAGLLHSITEIPTLIAEASTSVCSASQNKFDTFNDVRFTYAIPKSCYHILAQACTTKPGFAVLLKRTSVGDNLAALNIHIRDKDIEMLPTSHGHLRLLIDNNEMPLSRLPYTDSSGSIEIKKDDTFLVVLAEKYGLKEVKFNGEKVKVTVASNMRGNMCGMCGRNDGESRHEFRMPNGRLAKSSSMFGHSWIARGEKCQKGCNVKHEHIDLGKVISLYGEPSKCYSTEPVLRCEEGCSPVESAAVTVGFHCLPTGTSVSPAQYSSFAEKSEDMEHSVEAYTECSCPTDLCAEA